MIVYMQYAVCKMHGSNCTQALAICSVIITSDDAESDYSPKSIKIMPSFCCFVGNVQDYFAPEMVLATGHGFSLDWWTLGIFVSLGRIGRSKLNIWR